MLYKLRVKRLCISAAFPKVALSTVHPRILMYQSAISSVALPIKKASGIIARSREHEGQWTRHARCTRSSKLEGLPEVEYSVLSLVDPTPSSH
ncbi:MAG: hypothetical protein ACJZ39_02495 [Candidatus Thalassarchaeaceae archaeon]